MKRYKLKKWVKVVITLLVVLFSLWVYSNEGKLGELAQNSNYYLNLCIAGWVWLFFGAYGTLSIVWND